MARHEVTVEVGLLDARFGIVDLDSAGNRDAPDPSVH
jgi:hypothetical protein